MHEIPESLIIAQAASAGIPLLKIYVSNDSGQTYEAGMLQVLKRVKQEGIHIAAFGDLFLEDLRRYRERQLQQVDMKALFPLWQIDSRNYLQSFFQSGFEAIICCVNGSMLDMAHCGKRLSPELIATFPAPADPCGENGEYHSFCYAGPVFHNPISCHAEGWFNRFFPSPLNEREQVCFRHLRFGDT